MKLEMKSILKSLIFGPSKSMYIYFNAFATIAHYKDIPFMKEKKKKFGFVL
jgi:hypothetical protein